MGAFEESMMALCSLQPPDMIQELADITRVLQPPMGNVASSNCGVLFDFLFASDTMRTFVEDNFQTLLNFLPSSEDDLKTVLDSVVIEWRHHELKQVEAYDEVEEEYPMAELRETVLNRVVVSSMPRTLALRSLVPIVLTAFMFLAVYLTKNVPVVSATQDLSVAHSVLPVVSDTHDLFVAHSVLPVVSATQDRSVADNPELGVEISAQRRLPLQFATDTDRQAYRDHVRQRAVSGNREATKFFALVTGQEGLNPHYNFYNFEGFNNDKFIWNDHKQKYDVLRNVPRDLVHPTQIIKLRRIVALAYLSPQNTPTLFDTEKYHKKFDRDRYTYSYDIETTIRKDQNNVNGLKRMGYCYDSLYKEWYYNPKYGFWDDPV